MGDAAFTIVGSVFLILLGCGLIWMEVPRYKNFSLGNHVLAVFWIVLGLLGIAWGNTFL